jgi:hypothetical protein
MTPARGLLAVCIALAVVVLALWAGREAAAARVAEARRKSCGHFPFFLHETAKNAGEFAQIDRYLAAGEQAARTAQFDELVQALAHVRAAYARVRPADAVTHAANDEARAYWRAVDEVTRVCGPYGT